jgi:hypothetical protein
MAKTAGGKVGTVYFKGLTGGGAEIIDYRDEQRSAASQTGYVCLRRPRSPANGRNRRLTKQCWLG